MSAPHLRIGHNYYVTGPTETLPYPQRQSRSFLRPEVTSLLNLVFIISMHGFILSLHILYLYAVLLYVILTFCKGRCTVCILLQLAFVSSTIYIWDFFPCSSIISI